MIRAVLRVLASLSLLLVFACASPPVPVEPPAAPAPPPPAVTGDRVIGTVRVTASALNVRSEASSEGAVITQVKKGTSLDVLADDDDSWTKVKLASGDTGWVASRFVTSGKVDTAKKKRSGCESDYAFVETPTLAFSDRARPGMVVVEASVNTKGVVTKTKVVSNTTGEESLSFLAEREIKSAKFSPPMRNCMPRAFIFTYRRTF